MRMRYATLAGLLIAGLLLAWTPSAGAATFTTNTKWRNCDNTKSAVSIRATFRDPARYYGPGRYMVKKWIKWDYLKARGKWRAADRYHTESNWLKITHPDYDYVTTAADRTKWGNLYYSRWRAHVTIKLIKNRKGPKDKVVDTIDIYPMKGSFREIGSHCGYDF